MLGEDGFGIIYFSTTLNVILCGVLEKGLNATTVREISSHYISDFDYICKFMRTSLTFCLGVYIIFSIFIYAAAPFLVERWIKLSNMDLATAADTIRIMGLSLLLAFPRSLYASAFRGLQKMQYNNIIDVSMSFLQQSGTIVILVFGGDIYSVSCWFGFCYLSGLTAYMFAAHFFFSSKALIPGFYVDVLINVRRFAALTASGSVLAVVHKQIDKVVLSKVLTIGNVGYYGFAYGTLSKAGIIVSAISYAAYPAFSELFILEDSDGLKKQYLKLLELISLTTIPIFAAVIFAAIPVTTYLLNQNIALTLFPCFLFLGIGFYFNGTLNLLYQLTLAINRPDISMRSNFFALFIVTPITIALTYFFGATGAAISWVAFNIYTYIYCLPKICKIFLKEKTIKSYIKAIQFFLVAIPSYGTAWLFLEQFGNFSIVGYFSAYLGGTVAFISIAAFIVGEDLRLFIIHIFRKVIGATNAG
jgi:O-antigen/teichoic acid export membrane protein